MTGGVGHAELRQFYATHFIPKMPPDMEMTPLSRTIGTDQLVDEMVVRFTHTVEMDWMLNEWPDRSAADVMCVLEAEELHGRRDRRREEGMVAADRGIDVLRREDSDKTPCRREADSNPRSPVYGELRCTRARKTRHTAPS
jgi:hypothetical protein